MSEALQQDRREFDMRLKVMDQKLDDHGNDLREIRNVLITIATQAEKLNALQAAHNEMRADFNELDLRVRAVKEFQASCPRKNVDANIKALWGIVLGGAGTIGTILLAHIFGGNK